MKQIQSIIDMAEQQCKANGSRLTNKRKQVLTGLLSADRALSAYELADYCKTEFDNPMPAMSVYRILDFLKQEELIHELKLANKYIACSHISCSHAHDASQFLICRDCQRVEEITMNKSTMLELQQSIKGAGFQLLNPQLEMHCICDACAISTVQ